MPMTFEEICSRLKRIDEISLLEILDISSEEIIGRFRDIIEDRIEELATEFEDEQESEAESDSL